MKKGDIITYTGDGLYSKYRDNELLDDTIRKGSKLLLIAIPDKYNVYIKPINNDTTWFIPNTDVRPCLKELLTKL